MHPDLWSRTIREKTRQDCTRILESGQFQSEIFLPVLHILYPYAQINLQLTTVKFNFRNSSALKSSNVFWSHTTICLITVHTLLIQGKLLPGNQTKWCHLVHWLPHEQNQVKVSVAPHHHHQCPWLHVNEDCCNLPFPPANTEPPSPTTSRMVVLPWSSILFRAKHKIPQLALNH